MKQTKINVTFITKNDVTEKDVKIFKAAIEKRLQKLLLKAHPDLEGFNYITAINVEA